ncbi:MAG: SHOCT domain-containing protein [Ruminococcaceae bacterium]|nr:SHOCT domain-containing protein [Oscillospiraceae bacterium]
MAFSLISTAGMLLLNAISHLANSNLRYAIYNGVASVGAGVVTAIIIAIIVKLKDYLFGRKTLFRIEYAGGCIAFDVSFYAKAEIDDFQKQLRRAKDSAEETATIKTVAVETPVQAPTQSSVPDDLRKYADLLKEGLISQEEYDAMKKKILGL